MSFSTHIGVALVLGILLSILPATAAEDKQVTLMLGGKNCGFYLEEVKQALNELSGVQAVDLESMEGHAIITVDTSQTKPQELTAAVKKLKGSGWHCAAEIME